MSTYKRDYVTTLPLLKQEAVEFSENNWNKFDADIGETLLKLLASTSHTVDYYFRKYLDNLLLPCDDWTSKSLIWELIGYKPPYIRADYLMVQLYWPNCGLLSYVPIYMYTPFKVVADGVTYDFMAAEDYLIPPMTSRVNIRLVQGSLQTIELESSKVKNNKVKISSDPIDYDLVTLSVSGQNWTQVRNVFYSPDTTKIYSLQREEDGIYLYFHSSWKTYVDDYNNTIKIYYITANQTFDDYTEDCLSIKFSGELLDTYGTDVSSFYRIFPLLNTDADTAIQPSTMEGDRVITTDDYSEKAKLYPGVATCKAYSWDNSAVVREPFVVSLIATGASGALRERTKEALVSYLQGIGSQLIKVNVYDPVYQGQVVRVLIDIGDFRGTLTEIQIRLTIKAALQEFYSLGSLEPGEEVSTKDLNSRLLRADSRILFVDTAIQNRVAANPFAIPILKSVIVITEAASVPLIDSASAIERITCVNFLVRSDSGTASDAITDFKATLLRREHLATHENIIYFDRAFYECAGVEDSLTTSFEFTDVGEWKEKKESGPLSGEGAVASDSISIEKLNNDPVTP